MSHSDHHARGLRVGGLSRFSTVDWPGQLVATVFTDGCPWDCAYCHNPHLLGGGGAAADACATTEPSGSEEPIAGAPLSWADVHAFLATRAGLLDGVVFSGGEPLMQRALPEAIGAARELGFKVGLHTNGAYPERFAEVLPNLSWVGLDIKAPSDGYDRVSGVPGSGDAARESLHRLVASGLDYEVRTTVHSHLTDFAALERLAAELAAEGVTRWVLQPYRTQGVRPGLPASVALTEAQVSSLSEVFGAPIQVR